MKDWREARELSERLHCSISQLGELFTLHFKENCYDTQDMAEMFNCSEALVYNVMPRGLKIAK